MLQNVGVVAVNNISFAHAHTSECRIVSVHARLSLSEAIPNVKVQFLEAGRSNGFLNPLEHLYLHIDGTNPCGFGAAI